MILQTPSSILHNIYYHSLIVMSDAEIDRPLSRMQAP